MFAQGSPCWGRDLGVDFNGGRRWDRSERVRIVEKLNYIFDGLADYLKHGASMKLEVGP